MTQLGNLDTGTAVIEDKDVIGNNFSVIDTGIYPFFVEEAFLETSKSGALGVHLTLKENKDGSGKVLEQTVWVRSGDKKGNKSYYIDSNKQQQALPGFLLLESLCEILVGAKLKDMGTTKMAAMVYDADEKKRVTQQVDMLKSLCGKPIYVAVMKQTVDKQVKNDAGDYINTGETREDNDIAKFFRAADKKSATECLANNDEPAAFYHTWLKNWEGKVRNRSSSKGKAAPAGASGGTGVTAMFDA